MDQIYREAQESIIRLKTIILQLLSHPDTPEEGLRNVDVSRALGVNQKHSETGHTGHVSAYLLNQLMLDDKVSKSDAKRWTIKK